MIRICYFVVIILAFLPCNTADASYRKGGRKARTAKRHTTPAKKASSLAKAPNVTVTVGGVEQNYVHALASAPKTTPTRESMLLARSEANIPSPDTLLQNTYAAFSSSGAGSNNNDEEPPYPTITEPEYLSQTASYKDDSPQKVLELQRQQEISSRSKLERPTESIYPKIALTDTDDLIEVNLEKTDLSNVLQWIESIFKIKFLTGDALDPATATTPKIRGKVISYKSHVALSKREVWDLFLRFLYIFGLTPIARGYEADYPTNFILTANENANREPLPSFIGLDWEDLPDNDTKIRYVYFVENSPVDSLFKIANELRSPKAVLYRYDPLNAIIFSDISSNIRSIMAIIAELDRVSMPEALSVLKLKHANARDVEKLYKELVSAETQQKPGNLAARFFQRKETTAVYFPENTRLIAEPRTNSLIILGNREGIEKVENFIINYVDTELKQPYSPLYVYELQYANAANIAEILNNVTNFGRDVASTKDAALYGGVRDGDKFFRPMTFIAEPTGNRLLIKGEKEDYLKVRDIIRKLDIKQPQVAIEVLIVNVLASKQKELGTQLRNKRVDTLGKNVEFQTSGIQNPVGTNQGIIVNQSGGLMGNLVQLASGQNVGSTLISLGSELVGGVWALFKALETYVYTNVVSHPFLTTTNKYTAQVSLGETRRVTTGTVQGSGQATETQDDVKANLTVKITPQINSEGIITLKIEISIDNFSDANVPGSARRETRVIKTIANVADGEILAIGGLLRKRTEDQTTKVPLLGNVPVLGWFFKNKTDSSAKDNLLVFIAPKIVEPQYGGGQSSYTANKANFAENMICQTGSYSDNRDPIHRWFFNQPEEKNLKVVNDFLTNADECNEPPENWFDATPGCPLNYPNNPVSTGAHPLTTAQNEAANKPSQKNRRRQRSSMLDSMPTDLEEVIT